MSIRKIYLSLALIILGIEVLVATQLAHIEFIRGSISDLLVTPLIYFAIQAFRQFRPWPLSVGIFLFACAVEGAQYFRLADALHFPKGSILYILLGNYFSLMDVLMYFLGCVAAFVMDTWLLQNRSSSVGGKC
jgi:hypothetical protein